MKKMISVARKAGATFKPQGVGRNFTITFEGQEIQDFFKHLNKRRFLRWPFGNRRH